MARGCYWPVGPPDVRRLGSVSGGVMGGSHACASGFPEGSRLDHEATALNLSIRPSAHPPIRPSVHPPIRPSIHPPIRCRERQPDLELVDLPRCTVP